MSDAKAQESAAVTPPEVLHRVEAVYPPQALASRQEATSVLLITVELDGCPGEVEVVESGGELFDAAAAAAVREWRFRPASRNGEPVRVRVRVSFPFVLPVAEFRAPNASTPPSNKESPQTEESSPKDEKQPDAAHTHPEADFTTTVRGAAHRRSEDRSAADFVVKRDVIAAAPRQEGAEILRTAPGVYIARAEGLAVAHRYMLRGFDADHGQDIEFRVGGLPINMPSHIHGQGYADLGFLPAEVVDELHASEGVYDPRQGDFAVAGSFDLRLGVERRGWQTKSSYGSFNTFRQLLVWAPPDQDRGSFGAVQYSQTDGFGQNRQGRSASGIVQSVFGSGPWRYRVLGILHGARSNMAGVVRADDVNDGRLGYYDTYSHATARAQNAFAGRILSGLFAEYRGPNGDNADVGLWAGLDNFRVQENFTGFLQRSQTLENVAGRGDLIEQQNRTKSIGLLGRYRTASMRPSPWARGTLELGFAGRVDEIDQAQNLLDATVHSQTWDRRVDASILGANLGFWGDLDWRLATKLRLRFGVRSDVLYYDVNDRLGNFAPSTRPKDAYIVGFRRSALGVAAGPRTSAEFKPLEWLSFRAAYGEGYRSPQARQLEDGEQAPFSKVRSADLGVRISPNERYQVTLSGYYTHLSDDVAFDAEEGRLERIGQTRRLGAVLHGQARPFDWLVGAASVTFVDAELLEPPPASAQEPQPPFKAGQNLPYVPPVVVRADLGARRQLTKAGRWDLIGRGGLGFSFLSARPLPFGEFSKPVGLFDASAGLDWGPFQLGVEAFNLLNSRYAATEFNFPSSWDPEGVRPRTPTRHIAAGAPFSCQVTLGVSL